MLHSFRSRLVLSNLFITLLGLIAVTIVFTQLLAQRSTEVKRADRQAQAAGVAQRIEHIFHLSPRLSAKQSIREVANVVSTASAVLRVRIIVVNPRGGFVIGSGQRTPYDTGSWHPLDTQALKRAEAAQQAVTHNGNLVRFQSPIHGTAGHPNAGAVLLVAPVTDVNPDAAAIRRVLLVALGTALAVWLLIGLYFAVSMSRPLVGIIDATARMARGDYAVRVPTRGDGEIARLAASFNEMAARVDASNRVLRDFVANVSHDLRTPLTMITGFSEALLDGTAQNEDIEESAAVIHQEALKMQQMVDDLLQLTKLEAGLLKPQPEITPVRPFVQAVLDRIERSMRGRPVAVLQNHVPSALPAMQIDRSQLERTLQNLLHNALQYTPPEGTVTIDAVAHGGWVQISVADTGSGIPADDLPRVFERFFRSDRSRERQHGHSGLGLAIVREIVEAHGGEVRAESTVGQGTTFRFTVPAATLPDPVEVAADGVAQAVSR